MLESVKRCKNDLKNACRFGDKKCWFRHEEETVLEETKNSGLTEQIFSIKGCPSKNASRINEYTFLRF